MKTGKLTHENHLIEQLRNEETLVEKITADDLVFSAAFHSFLGQGYSPKLAAVKAIEAMEVARQEREAKT